MKNEGIGVFISNMMENLVKHGFPEKSVSFPYKSIQNSVSKKGYELDDILEFLREKGIHNSRNCDRIVFSAAKPTNEAKAAKSSSSEPIGDTSQSFEALFGNQDLGSVVSQASQLLKSMNTDQLEGLKKYIDDVKPQYITSFMKQFDGLSQDEKDQILKKAKDALKDKKFD